tara:strand:+ start:160 stop:309 length:150 start_codon:yes stop_codon:yes gene_type:complete
MTARSPLWYNSGNLQEMTAAESVGFNKIGGWIDEGFEFGPNCIAIKQIL